MFDPAKELPPGRSWDEVPSGAEEDFRSHRRAAPSASNPPLLPAGGAGGDAPPAAGSGAKLRRGAGRDALPAAKVEPSGRNSCAEALRASEETFESERDDRGHCEICGTPSVGAFECLRCGLDMCASCHPRCGCPEMLANLASSPPASLGPSGPRTVLFLGPYAKADTVDDMSRDL